MSNEKKKLPGVTVFSQDQRELVLSPSNPSPFQHRGDPTKLKVKREKRESRGEFATGLGRYSKPGKTARDHAKPKSSQKTNDPSICQKMKGQKGSK